MCAAQEKTWLLMESLSTGLRLAAWGHTTKGMAEHSVRVVGEMMPTLKGQRTWLGSMKQGE